jgi:hypothetical protein
MSPTGSVLGHYDNTPKIIAVTGHRRSHNPTKEVASFIVGIRRPGHNAAITVKRGGLREYFLTSLGACITGDHIAAHNFAPSLLG